MRKKLIALSVALLTIGGSLSFASTAKADVQSGATNYLVAAATDAGTFFTVTNYGHTQQMNTNYANGAYWYNQRSYGLGILGFSPDPFIKLSAADVCSAYSYGMRMQECPQAQDDGSQRLSLQGHGFRIGDTIYNPGSGLAVIEVWETNNLTSHYLDTGIVKNVSVADIANDGWTLCYSADLHNNNPQDIALACTGNYILLAGGYYTGQEPTPALTLPPDFLPPKTYGNPASVTGYAPAAPAVAITPTAPVITAGATSVIYNGVPQSAPYSVDQKSSCSTTYNGSAIAPVAAGTYAVSITCSANSLTSTATTTLTITKATPVISWSTPGAITSTTKLGASQLNAFSYIPGSFTYSASAGSSLPQGDDLITATFTPTDTTNYTSATMTVTIKVTA